MPHDNEVVLSPRREKGEKPIPARGLFVLTPNEARRTVEEARANGASRRRLFHSQLVVMEKSLTPCFVAGPAVGAPMAAMTLEKLIALGAREILLFGWCGSLSPKLAVGDVLVPSWAASEEGTSRHYPVAGRPLPDPSLIELLTETCTRAGLRPMTGPIWTTDAPYRETRARVRHYAEQGVLAVDMEYAALLTLAVFRQVKLAAAFLVSDEPWREIWQPGYNTSEFRAKSRSLVDRLVHLLQRERLVLQ